MIRMTLRDDHMMYKAVPILPSPRIKLRLSYIGERAGDVQSLWAKGSGTTNTRVRGSCGLTHDKLFYHTACVK